MKYYKLKTVCTELQRLNVRTAKGFPVVVDDVKKAVAVMNKKHGSCEWVNRDSKNIRISLEGYFWIYEVYFNHSKKMIDADVTFFENIIEDYAKTCNKNNIEYTIKTFIEKNMTIEEFCNFTNRKLDTVKKAYSKLRPFQKNLCYIIDGKKYLPKSVCEILCQKYFKMRYLQYLEEVYLDMRNTLLKEGVTVEYE